jgi:hypothetical protein
MKSAEEYGGGKTTTAARNPRRTTGLDLLAEKNVQIGKTSNRDQETWP